MKRELSLVQTTEAFPELPDMSSSPPGALKGDGSSKKGIDSDDPANYEGMFQTLYDYKMKAKAIYQTDTCQLIVAGVIFLNFIVVMFSVTQFVLDNKDAENVCDDLDTIFISFFMVELFLNMLTSAQGIEWVKDAEDKDDMQPKPEIISPFFWQWEFWVGENWGWNWFDFIVIMVPVVMAGFEFASSIRILRLFRVIRVLKSIAKFEALQVVASSVSRSVAGVGAVSLMIFGLMCCYAIVGVVFFGRKEFFDACTKAATPTAGEFNVQLTRPVYPKDEVVTWARWAEIDGFKNTIYGAACSDYEMLYDCFANLRRALYTTFMMMTLESWPDLCWASVSVYKYGAAYFVSFVAINAMMMANLIIAVFTTRMDKVADMVKADTAAATQKRRQKSINTLKMNDKSTVQGIDLDGDGIADEFIIDADGDGVADIKLTSEEMAQIWTVGEPIEVYSHTIMQWCPGQVKEVSHSDKRIKVEYDVDGNTLGEKTIPFKHDSIRRPAGASIGGKNVKVMATSTMNMDSLGGVKIDGFSFQGLGQGQNSGDLANVLKSFQAKLDSIGQKVDTLMSDKSQKGKARP